MKKCEMIPSCGFYTKYEKSMHIDCRGFIDSYCRGRLMNDCARFQFMEKNGNMPHDDMLPSGKILECGKSIEPYTDHSNQQYY